MPLWLLYSSKTCGGRLSDSTKSTTPTNTSQPWPGQPRQPEAYEKEECVYQRLKRKSSIRIRTQINITHCAFPLAKRRLIEYILDRKLICLSCCHRVCWLCWTLQEPDSDSSCSNKCQYDAVLLLQVSVLYDNTVFFVIQYVYTYMYCIYKCMLWPSVHSVAEMDKEKGLSNGKFNFTALPDSSLKKNKVICIYCWSELSYHLSASSLK